VPCYSRVGNLEKEIKMPGKVELNVMAPDFSLPDFGGQQVRLADFRGDRHVVLVFNRGFM